MKRLLSVLSIAAIAAGLSPLAAQAQGNGNGNGKPAFVADQVLVKYRASASASDQNRARGRANGQAAEQVRGRANGLAEVELVKLPAGANVDAAIAALQADPAVEFAEPNYVYTHNATSNDTYFTNGSLWGMYGATTSPANQFGSNAAAAWAAGYTGSSTVYVGIIDEGIDYNHPDLAANIWNNPFDPVDGIDNDGNGYADDTYGWDFAGNDRTVYDGGKGDTHGTHVAGTIGGVGGNGAGVAGVVWNVKMISAKFLGRNGGTTANAIKAVDYITDLKTRHGLNIVATNNSWGGGGYSQALYDAIERANTAGILFVAAAGNGGSDGVGDNNDTTANYPSNYANSNVIAVAAITNAGARSSFSNYGATTVDIGAPGSAIFSTLPKNTYGSYNGTSMATPHVTGAVALYASVKPGSTAAQIKNAILSSATPTTSLSGITVTGGRLNAFAALSR